jgi:WD40 repeat protein
MWRHDARVNAVAVSPRGLVFSGSDDTTVRLWRLDTSALVKTLAAHRARVNVIAQGPGADELVSVSDDFSVRLWQVDGTAPVCTFTAEAPVTACAIGCNDTIIVGDQGGRIHFLRIERGDHPDVR